jgi:hypothetical protein
MIKRLIFAISIALIIDAGLWFLLFLGGTATFSGLFDRLLNNELFVPERKYSVKVNVYEVKTGGSPEMTFDRVLGNHPDLEDALKQYFIEYNNVLGSLGSIPDDMVALSALYERYSRNRNVDLLILEQKLQTRKQSAVDLRFDVCDVGLQLISVSFGAEDFVELRVSECFATVFKGVDDRLSSYTGVEHFFVLDKRSGDWLIKRHESNSALSVYITGELQKLIEAEGHSMQAVDTSVINDYTAQLRSVLLDREIYFYPAETIQHENETATPFFYERDSALEYAARFTHRERVRRNHEFPEFERNGTNFISQCLNAGGIHANERWNWDSGAAAREIWANAAKFYEYITSPDSHIAANVCDSTDGEAGDIIQFVDGGGQAVHSVLITEVIRGNSADNVEYLVTSNSEDLRGFPLSALGFDIMRVIKVRGFYYSP